MMATSPSPSAYDKWVENTYSIACDAKGNCLKEDRPLWFRSSHYRNTGLFASYEQTFEDAEGEEITIRTFGVLGQFFEMENGRLWDMLN